MRNNTSQSDDVAVWIRRTRKARVNLAITTLVKCSGTLIGSVPVQDTIDEGEHSSNVVEIRVRHYDGGEVSGVPADFVGPIHQLPILQEPQDCIIAGATGPSIAAGEHTTRLIIDTLSLHLFGTAELSNSNTYNNSR